jgi:acetylornithine deacetylase/succinyl-diaminopimelate desuccinylase-like protein
MQRWLLITLLVLSGSGPSTASAQNYPADAVTRLIEYIQIDTTNPPGNESRGVEYFAAIFDAAGIAYDTAESAPGRGNIWARLDGGRKPALVLLNHIDVVPADPRYWTVPPLSGEIREGYIYGRGAGDMKGSAIVQLQAFLALHASGARLSRDVIFMATADEEAGGAYGAGWLVHNRPELFENVGFLLNEGGRGTRYGEQTVFSIEVTQKVPLWLRVTARGEPGHGSSWRSETAVTRLLRAASRIAETQFPVRVIEPVAAAFKGVAPYQSAEFAEGFADLASVAEDRKFMRLLELKAPWSHALLRDACSVTRLNASDKINVVPPEAYAEVDCRLLPDRDPQAFVRDLEILIGDPRVSVEVLMSFTPAVSTTDTELFAAIETLAASQFPGALTISGVTTGFTDSHFFRDLGIISYGFSPFVSPFGEDSGVHGNDERISVENVEAGTRFMIELLRRFASD